MLGQRVVVRWPSAASGSVRRCRRTRRGFSLLELLLVLVISGILMRVTMPKFAAFRDRTAVSGAKQQIASYLAGARAAAIRQSQTATFHVVSDQIWTTVNQSSGSPVDVQKVTSISKSRGVSVNNSSSTDSPIVYDPRGFGRSAATKYVLSRNGVKDSLCVTTLGMIQRYCGP